MPLEYFFGKASVEVLTRGVAIVQARQAIARGPEMGGCPQRLITLVYSNDKSAGTPLKA